MTSSLVQKIATLSQTTISSTQAVLDLLAEGATIPFIARYRKDKTGGLDEVQIAQIQDLHKEILAFEERKTFIIKTITEQEKMTDDLLKNINEASNINQLEDIYLPFKPKRRTKAQIARENGLEPLAQLIWEQEFVEIEIEAEKFLNENIKDASSALQGARDIISEQINEDAQYRTLMRNWFEKDAQLIAKVISEKETEGAKYKDYFDYSESIQNIPSHRILAVLRGFMEGILRISIEPEEEKALSILEENIIQKNNNTTPHLQKAIKDAYKRLMQPALETEFRNQLKTQADEEAIQVFAANLKQLLLSSPLGEKRIIAIDPGYRTGCKVVVIDEKGDLLHNDLIFVHEKNHKLQEAENLIQSLVKKYNIESFAIGDGTAGRETEQFIQQLNLGLPIFLVNEDGASIYSASEIARAEFPNYDVTVRGAVSIGRRLMDPLAELVKIDPKSIGVGQYQHDVNQFRLKEKLDQTVESCVNAVGVNLNTAGKHLLAYVSGIGPSIAENIIQYRKENGTFRTRKELLKVPRLGAKAYEQSAGFLKIANGAEPLDNSTVHPESYDLVAQMAKAVNLEVSALIGNAKALEQLNPKDFITSEIGLHTIQDTIKELKKPGLDPREPIQNFQFASIYKIEDVIVDSIVPGIVTNLTKFGAFVDIGVKQDGLVHVSEIANRYIADPAEALQLNQKVQVKVMAVDLERKRITLSIKQALPEGSTPNKTKPKHSNTSKPSEKPQSNYWFASLENLKTKLK